MRKNTLIGAVFSIPLVLFPNILITQLLSLLAIAFFAKASWLSVKPSSPIIKAYEEALQEHLNNPELREKINQALKALQYYRPGPPIKWNP